MGQKDQVVGKICKLMCHSPLCPLREEAGIWITNRPPKGQRHTFCRIQILFRSNPATDIRKSAQPTSTSYPASTNKERIGASEASLKTSKSHFMLYFLESGAQPKISTHTITLPLYLGVPTHKVHQLATKLHCHAMKSLNKITKTRQNTLTTTTVIMGDLEGGVLVERLASGGLGAGRIAWLTFRWIPTSLCCFSFSFFGGDLASVSTSWEPFLEARWWLPV